MSKTRVVCNATVVTMGQDRRIVLDGALAYRDDRIVAVGKTDEVLRRFPDAERQSVEGSLVTPGFVDAHNHPSHFLTKGLLDDIDTTRRWQTRLYPYECSVNEEEMYWGSLGTFAEMLLHGTTCVSDPGSFYPRAVARAADRMGIRALITAATTDVHDPLRPFSADARNTPEGAVAFNERLYEELNGAADGRVRIAFGLWSNNTVSDELCRRVTQAAEKHGAVIHGHLSTRESDNDASLQRYGCRSVERYRRLGVLGPNFTAAHLGAINEAEVEIVARAGATVVHCPTASMLGAFGCISRGKFPELVAAGVSVGLGSDAASISRFLDMPRIMYIAGCAHKDVRMNAEIMGAHRAMEMATLGGARSVGLDSEIGVLEEGRRADFAVFRTDGIEWQPRPQYNPVATLVYSSGGYRAQTVVVNGKTVVEHGRLTIIDEAELRDGAMRAARSATVRAGLAEESVWPMN